MKKIITLFTLAILSIGSTFASDIDINKTAQANFAAHFAKATNVKWEKNDTYYKTSFQLNGQALSALFAENGDMIAVSRNILSPELPVQLQSALKIDLSDNWISELVEYVIDGQTKYYATVEDANGKIVYESLGTYDWEMVKKIAK